MEAGPVASRENPSALDVKTLGFSACRFRFDLSPFGAFSGATYQALPPWLFPDMPAPELAAGQRVRDHYLVPFGAP